MVYELDKREEWVNCRVGSLENYQAVVEFDVDVNCRVGSLEKSFLQSF